MAWQGWIVAARGDGRFSHRCSSRNVALVATALLSLDLAFDGRLPVVEPEQLTLGRPDQLEVGFALVGMIDDPLQHLTTLDRRDAGFVLSISLGLLRRFLVGKPFEIACSRLVILPFAFGLFALALATAGAGDLALALRHFAESEARERRMGLLPKLAITLILRGLLEQRAGGDQAVEGRARVSEGLRLAEEIGIGGLARRVADSAPVAAKPRPKGLSERQLEVLRLLAEGRTNREIAGALSISVGTVANHLTAIFTKTGVDNRAEAVAFAHSRGLTRA